MLDLSDTRKNEIRAAALQSVRANFSVARMCAETLDVYRTVNG